LKYIDTWSCYNVIVFPDGVVKSPIWSLADSLTCFVAGFSQNLNIACVWLRFWEKHYASYLELFNLAIYGSVQGNGG